MARNATAVLVGVPLGRWCGRAQRKGQELARDPLHQAAEVRWGDRPMREGRLVQASYAQATSGWTWTMA